MKISTTAWRAGWRGASAALVLVATGTALPLAQAVPMGTGPAMHGAMSARAGMESHRIERLLESAGASAEQKAKVREIMRAAHDELRQQRDGSRALHAQMLQVLTAPQLDAAAFEALRQQSSTQRELAAKRMAQAMFDASAVLTPEQRVKLGERIKQRREMMERHQHERRALDDPSKS